MNLAKEAKLMSYFAEYIPNVFLAIVVLFIGWWSISFITQMVKRSLKKLDLDPSLKPYLTGITNVGLKLLLFIVVAGILGAETSSFVAILGAAGLAVGLALRDNLSNFAAGIFILMFKPFKVGDFISGAGVDGTVEKILIFQTFLVTPDQKVVLVPNSALANNNVTNFSAKENRRLDVHYGISYSDNIDHARAALLKLVDSDERVLKDPAPQVFVTGLLDSSVELRLRVWMKASDYWPLNFHLLEHGKKELENAGITIPFPQRDVHLYQTNTKQ